MTKRYVLHPGPVWSRTDREIHLIGAGNLAQLYGVPLGECYIASVEHGHGIPDDPALMHLYPQDDGRYALPEEKERTR